MTDNLDKVVERVRKLMRLAENDGATEAEAALAATKAQEIMADHNLTMAAVEAAGGLSGDDARREDAREVGRAMYGWQRKLMEAVARANFCYSELVVVHNHINIRGNARKGYRIIGRASNVAACRTLFDYLASAINRLTLADCGGDNRLRMSRAGHSFAEGCADRLCERVTERHEAIVEERSRRAREANAAARHPSAATGNALVVVMADYEQAERDANDDARLRRAPGTTARLRVERESREDAAKIARDERARVILAELLAEGLEAEWAKELAGWMASGWSRERAEAILRPAPPKPETDRQREKRIEKEERERARWNEQYWRKQAKRDHAAYERGGSAADDVGLDEQVERDKGRGRLT